MPSPTAFSWGRRGLLPFKGMHFVLEAMALLVPNYPDCRLYVAGSSVISHGTLKEKLKLPAYGKYLLSQIKGYGLEKHVTMLGKLDAEGMKEQYLKSSVSCVPLFWKIPPIR